MASMTRRAVLTAVPALMTLPVRGAPQSLRILTWRHYGTDETWAMEAFEAQTGLGLINDYYASADEALDRLEKRGETYDIVVLNAAQVPRAIARGLLEPIPVDGFDGFAKIAPPLKNNSLLKSDDALYAVAWTWGMTGLSRRASKSPAGQLRWSDLWEAKFKGRVGIRNNALDAVEIAALSLGQDPASIEDFDAVEARLAALAGQVAVLWDSEDAWNKAFAERQFELAVNWSTSVARARRFFNLPVEFCVPAEGAIGWFDCLALPAKETRREGALKLLDYLSNDDFLVNWATRIGAPAPANLSALGKLASDDPTRQIHRPELIEKLIILNAPDDALKTHANEIWDRLRQGFGGQAGAAALARP